MKKYLYHDELAPQGHLFDHDVEMDESWVDSPAKLKSFSKAEKEKAKEDELAVKKKLELEEKIEASKVKKAEKPKKKEA